MKEILRGLMKERKIIFKKERQIIELTNSQKKENKWQRKRKTDRNNER